MFTTKSFNNCKRGKLQKFHKKKNQHIEKIHSTTFVYKLIRSQRSLTLSDKWHGNYINKKIKNTYHSDRQSLTGHPNTGAYLSENKRGPRCNYSSAFWTSLPLGLLSSQPGGVLCLGVWNMFVGEKQIINNSSKSILLKLCKIITKQVFRRIQVVVRIFTSSLLAITTVKNEDFCLKWRLFFKQEASG